MLTHSKKLGPSYVSWITHTVVLSAEARFKGPICGRPTLDEWGRNKCMRPACARGIMEKACNSKQKDGPSMTRGYRISWWIKSKLLVSSPLARVSTQKRSETTPQPSVVIKVHARNTRPATPLFSYRQDMRDESNLKLINPDVHMAWFS